MWLQYHIMLYLEMVQASTKVTTEYEYEVICYLLNGVTE